MTEPRDKTAKRKRTEEALRESEERYRDLVENATDLIQSVTPEGSLIYVNRAWRETLGYSEDEIPGLSLMDIIHPDSKAHCAETFQRVMAGGDIERVEAMFVAKDGRTVTVEGSVNCSFKDGKPVATRGIFRAITQHKQAEEALRIKDRAIASSTNAIAIADPEGNLTYVNASFLSLWGYVEQEVLGKPATGFWTMEERASEVVQELRWEGSWIGELVARKKDGSLFYVQLSASMVTNEAGEPVCMMSSFVDITERRQALQALWNQTHDLGERVKELNCLYGISNLVHRPDISLEEILQETVDLIPPGWQYPEVTCARITLEGQEFRTENFRETVWRQTSDIIVNGERSGAVEVCYLEERRESDEGSFLPEKGDLINAIAERLGRVIERRQAEEALRDSEEQLRNVLEVSRDLIYKLNLQTQTYDYVSPSSLRLVGFAPQEIVAMGLEGVIERFHPDDRERFRTYPSRLPDDTVEGREAPTVEYRWQCRDGEYRWLSDNRAFVLDEGGRALTLVGTVRDVTEDKQAEEALRESEPRFRNVLDMSRDFIYKIDLRTGTYDYASPSVLELTGFTPEEVVAMGLGGLGERIHPEDGKRLTEGLKDLTKDRDEGQRNTLSVYRWKRKDGEYRWFSDNSVFIRYSNEQPAALIGAVRDITAQKQAEEALRESEEKYRQLVENLQEGVWALDKDANTTFANPRMAEILGYTVSEMLGRHLFSFMDEQGQELARLNLERRQQGIAEQHEFEFLRKDGTRVYTSLATNPVTDRNGNYIGALAAVTDITDKKQAEEEIANRLKMESAIAQASTLLAGPEDIDAALQLALRILSEAVGADRAHIFLFRDDNTRMDCTSEWCAPGVEPRIDNLQDLDCAAIPWWMGKLAQNELIIMTNTSAAPPEAAPEKKSWKALNIRSLLAVPLLSDGKPIGYVRFANMESASNEREEDTRLLRLASESIASFIQRQRAGEDKRKAYESIIFLLATAAEARDPYTEDHLPRIRGFAEAMAAELGLPPGEIREIGLSSLLHDLGKMRVPDSILIKPGPLSQAEWKIMRQHPAWGEELLSTHPWLETARQIARWHHENWDGTGYPDGLRGEEIPLCAAIVAVADGFDAMASDRPYKKAWPSRRAIEEVRAQKGRHYSPDVVEAFNRALRKGEIGRITSGDSARLPEMSEAA